MVHLPPGVVLKRGGHANVRTNRAREVFLATLRQSCNVSESCRKAGMSRTTAYAWRAEDPDFMADWQDAESEAVEKLEGEAWRRAVEGYEETTAIGDKVTRSHKYSDRMLEILLKGHRPDKYRERVSTEVSGPGGKPVEVAFDPSKISDAALAELMAARKAG